MAASEQSSLTQLRARALPAQPWQLLRGLGSPWPRAAAPCLAPRRGQTRHELLGEGMVWYTAARKY